MIELETYRVRIGHSPVLLEKILNRMRLKMNAHPQMKQEHLDKKHVWMFLIVGVLILCTHMYIEYQELRGTDLIMAFEYFNVKYNVVQLCTTATICVVQLSGYAVSCTIVSVIASKQLGLGQCLALLLVIGGIEVNPGPVDWEMACARIGSCQNFTQLAATVNSMNIDPIQDVKGNRYQTSYKCDTISREARPTDCPIPPEQFFPIQTQAIGNCFPCSLSRLVYGNEEHAVEMRVRLVIEGVKNIDLYTDDNYLSRALTHPFRYRNAVARYCTYSGSFRNSRNSNQRSMQRLTYQDELMDISKNLSYCGIWQFHQAANVLQCPIYSIYPNHLQFDVRGDLNRLILPFDATTEKETCYIMWTYAARSSALCNHFVPVVRYVQLHIYMSKT